MARMTGADFPRLARVAADYAIAALRYDLDLHYECCDHARPEQYANQCHLTDGQSFLSTWFTTDPVPFGGNVRTVGTVDGVGIFFCSQSSEDSVRQFVPEHIFSVARDAFQRFFGTSPVVDQCALLSFEFYGASAKTKIEAWFRSQPALNFEWMPKYAGTYREIDRFFVDDSHGCWGQCVCSPPWQCKDIRHMFGGLMRDFDRWDVGSMATFDPTPILQGFGIRKVHVVSRRY